VDALQPGRRHRVRDEHAQAGGKGVNVARVLAALGGSVRTVVLVGGETGRAIAADVARSGLAPVVVQAAGESRTCLEVLEWQGGRATQLHGCGVRADAATARALVDAVAASLEGAEWLALCGSLPPGLAPDLYARLAAVGRARGVRVALDSSGPALHAGWAARPELLRINREEAADVLGAPDPAALVLPPLEPPAPVALGIVSDGPRAVVAWSGDGAVWRVRPPRIEARNPIGCGDAMLAGLLASLGRHPVPEALRYAVALAAADAEAPTAGRPDLARARILVPEVDVERIAAPVA
jgi:tagatose 6-phosphate kinase